MGWVEMNRFAIRSKSLEQLTHALNHSDSDHTGNLTTQKTKRLLYKIDIYQPRLSFVNTGDVSV